MPSNISIAMVELFDLADGSMSVCPHLGAMLHSCKRVRQLYSLYALCTCIHCRACLPRLCAANTSADVTAFNSFHRWTYAVALPLTAVVGIVLNMLNVFVFTRLFEFFSDLNSCQSLKALATELAQRIPHWLGNQRCANLRYCDSAVWLPTLQFRTP